MSDQELALEVNSRGFIPGWLDVYDFGFQLLQSNDLDPVYFLPAALPAEQRPAWLVAYWCYYDVGTALLVSAEKDFWAAMRHADNALPRGTERRHFRGTNSAAALFGLARTYARAESMVDALSGCRTFGDVKQLLKSWPAFGPWATFKVADMCERVLNVPIDFSDCELEMYAEPVKACKLLAPKATVKDVVDHLILAFQGNVAPPKYDRPVGLQEVETILCKWKSHVTGHYPVGKDTAEIKHRLIKMVSTRQPYAQAMLDALNASCY